MKETLIVPKTLLPADGRFGAGPSRIRGAQVDALASAPELGTSHRAAPVKARVQNIREGLRELFSLPSGFEIAIGNGGATAFWAVAATSLVRESAKCAVFGEFGAKCAADWAAAPWLSVEAVEAPPGALSEVRDEVGQADVYAYPQNETSTGVASPLYRGAPGEALTVVDATSIAGATPVDWDLIDTYYFSPQKCFGSDGGLWLAVMSPAAIERAKELDGATGRYMPSFLNLASALKQSSANQTLNTPAIASLILLDEQVKWLLEQGGLAVAAESSQSGADLVAQWAKQRPWAELFVKDPAWRSPVTTTVDLAPELPVKKVSGILRAAGIVDVDGYRKLGRNQLRISTFPSVPNSDVQSLLDSIDWVAERLLEEH